MQFSIARTIITPDRPVFMAGFGSRTHKSEGVLDELYVKAVILKANKLVLILTFDLLGGDRSFVNGLKETLYGKFGLPPEDVLLNFSHTHASVFATGEDRSCRRGYYSIAQADRSFAENGQTFDDEEDIRYFHQVVSAVCVMVGEALGRLEDGTLTVSSGTSDAAVSRRLLRDGKVLFQPNYEAAIDKQLTVLRLYDSKENLKGIMFQYGCHPTVMNGDNYLLSAEFVGYARTCLETDFAGAEAVFLQGCGAELKPEIGVADGRYFKNGSILEMREGGRRLADDVVRIMEQGKGDVVDCRFLTSLHEVRLQTRPIAVEQYERRLQHPDTNEFYKHILRRLLHRITTGTSLSELPLYIAVWHLDARTRLIAIEGEVSTAYALKLKARLAGFRTIPLGYSNGLFTYIPSGAMIGEGGYEVDHYQFYGLRGPFVPEIEEVIVERAVSAALAANDP